MPISFFLSLEIHFHFFLIYLFLKTEFKELFFFQNIVNLSFAFVIFYVIVPHHWRNWFKLRSQVTHFKSKIFHCLLWKFPPHSFFLIIFSAHFLFWAWLIIWNVFIFFLHKFFKFFIQIKKFYFAFFLIAVKHWNLRSVL